MCALLSLASVAQGVLEDYHVSTYAPAIYSFLLLVSIPFKEYTRICLFIHLLMDMWVVSGFWSRDILNLAAMNFLCQSLCDAFLSLGETPGSGIAGT